MLSRRMLLSGSTSAAVAFPLTAWPSAGPIPITLTQLRNGWKENTETKAAIAVMKPLLDGVHRVGNIHALSLDGWTNLATATTKLANTWGELGNLHRVDTYVLEHQAALRTRYKPQAVGLIVDHGTHYGLAFGAEAMLHTVIRLRDQAGISAATAPILDNGDTPWGMRCDVNFTFWDVTLGMLSILLELPPLALLGAAIAMAAIFICHD